MLPRVLWVRPVYNYGKKYWKTRGSTNDIFLIFPSFFLGNWKIDLKNLIFLPSKLMAQGSKPKSPYFSPACRGQSQRVPIFHRHAGVKAKESLFFTGMQGSKPKVPIFHRHAEIRSMNQFFSLKKNSIIKYYRILLSNFENMKHYQIFLFFFLIK